MLSSCLLMTLPTIRAGGHCRREIYYKQAVINLGVNKVVAVVIAHLGDLW